MQGTRDLNPQPSVLETDALPVELVPFGGPVALNVVPAVPGADELRDGGAGMTTKGANHQDKDSTG